MSEELEIIKEKEDQPLAKLDNFGNANEMLEFAKVLIKSGLVPSGLNTPEKVVTVVLQGKELGFGAVTSLGCIHNIQGKATLSVHAVAALLKKSGIVYKLLADFETTKKPDGSLDLDDTGKPKDKITTIRFYQKFSNQVIENDISYRWSEAVSAGYTSKDNWKKMPK